MTDQPLTRTVQFIPGYDQRHTDPHKNYGVHGMDIRFLLQGPKGVVQLVLFTGWLPRAAAEEYARTFPNPPDPYQAYPADLGYHAYVPQYPDQSPMREPCWALGTAQCYYDGSTLNARHVYWILVNEEEEAMWAALKDHYDGLEGPDEAVPHD